MNGKEKLKFYVDRFNGNDEESVVNLVDNASAYDFLAERIPLLHCPDENIEETYYFRFWTLRKHIKKAGNGKYVFSEFLKTVPWGGPDNVINAAAGHHVAEARWFSDASLYIEDYAKYFLNGNNRAFIYSAWLITALYDYCRIRGDFSLLLDNFDMLETYFAEWEKRHLTSHGLYWSIDNFDAMEFSISGTPSDLKRRPGIRPLLNSYMFSEASVLAKLAHMKGLEDKKAYYEEKAEALRRNIEERLWDGEFYKAIHGEDAEAVYSTRDIPAEQNARELLGYVPFGYGLGNKERAMKMFPLLTDPKVFLAETGLATADRSHPRYLYSANHECLWNGYVWPFATSQTLDACIHAMNRFGNDVMSNEDFTALLSQYAKMHHLIRADGTTVNWIDEMMHPDKLEWTTREWLYSDKYIPAKGDRDRGRDYNHSTFCDLVIHGLVGVNEQDGHLVLHPHIPENWEWLKLENLTFRGKKYSITYDKTGKIYGGTVGWSIVETK